MKQLIVFVLLSSLAVPYEKNDKLFHEANEMYISENYSGSIEIYESIISSNRANSAIFYNLGNSYFRLKKIGQAIWAYRHAKRLSPRDKDIIHNLNIAEAFKVDRINRPTSFVFHEFYRKIKFNFTIFEWLLMGSFLFLLLSLISFYRNFYDKKNKFLINISQVNIIFIIIVHSVILDKFFQEKKRNNRAIIIKKVDAHSGPLLGSNKILFQINEGSMAEVLEENNNWSQVILLDGKKGWVLTKSIRKMN